MLASREFMTSVVVGKDVVPRIGMHQLETLRYRKVVDILVILGMTWIMDMVVKNVLQRINIGDSQI